VNHPTSAIISCQNDEASQINHASVRFHHHSTRVVFEQRGEEALPKEQPKRVS
jgi:hypothetical protein